MTQNVDLFADLTDSETSATDAGASNVDGNAADVVVSDTATDTNSASSDADENVESNDAPVETVSEAPEGAMGVTEFAAFLTSHFMREAITSGEDFDMAASYVVPQAVYQTVRAAKDRIPHVLVKAEGSDEAKVYILKEEGLEWWLARKERLATRGTGISKSASQRTPDDNKVLLGNAVESLLYAIDRKDMWTEKHDKAEKLVAKYKGFLADAKVSDDDMATVIQEATNRYEAEKAEKLRVKAAKKTTTTDSNNAE